jgi:hypothetical protein
MVNATAKKPKPMERIGVNGLGSDSYSLWMECHWSLTLVIVGNNGDENLEAGEEAGIEGAALVSFAFGSGAHHGAISAGALQVE